MEFGKGNYGYHNAQNAKLVGINITAQLDFNGLWNVFPTVGMQHLLITE